MLHEPSAYVYHSSGRLRAESLLLRVQTLSVLQSYERATTSVGVPARPSLTHRTLANECASRPNVIKKSCVFAMPYCACGQAYTEIPAPLSVPYVVRNAVRGTCKGFPLATWSTDTG
jgi:hypothetical protein